jgi:hypothetical protein
MNQLKVPEGKKALPVETPASKTISSTTASKLETKKPLPVSAPAPTPIKDSGKTAKTETNKPMPIETPTDKLDPAKKAAEALNAGANAAMGIFDRADKMKTPPPKALHTANITDDKSIEYFLKKAEEIENQYKKTEVHVYCPDNKLLATLPTTNLEDGTDMTAGRTTLRNTLKGFLGQFKKLTLHIQPSGINYPDKK